jgi:predicted ester cyclase
MRVNIDDVVAEGDKLVFRLTMRGTHPGALMGLPPTGEQAAVAGISIRRSAGGKLVEGWDAHDALGMLQQLGAMPAPAQAGR